jgi:hypothetical protein
VLCYKFSTYVTLQNIFSQNLIQLMKEFIFNKLILKYHRIQPVSAFTFLNCLNSLTETFFISHHGRQKTIKRKKKCITVFLSNEETQILYNVIYIIEH